MSTDQAQRPLTLKQERFVSHYITTGNATQSAIAAGYSQQVARQQASENLSKPVIQQAIQQRKAELAQSQGITDAQIISKLWERACQDDNLSASVSALGKLAEIKGLLAGNARELPDALNAMLEAVKLGMSAGQQASLPASKQAIESSMREVADLNEDAGKQG